MNKTAIRNFATKARRDLMEQVALRARELGVTVHGCGGIEIGPDYVVIGGVRYPAAYRQSHERLCAQWKAKGFAQLIEEVAYTWFNRMVAIRYMEIHDYLPSHLRVLSSAQTGGLEPQLLTQYRDATFSMDIPYVEQAVLRGDREVAYRHLLVRQCDELHRIMPFLFEPIADYTELLLPMRLLHADSVIQRLVREIPEEDFAEVEIIGWMYQFYIAERKDEIFAALTKGRKIAKEDIAPATQMFTPAWIVQYMVQNSVGRLWMESQHRAQMSVPAQWSYYVTSAPQTDQVREQLASSRLPITRPEDIRVLDPACGSGHILVYAYDLLFGLYEQLGYENQEIPYLILDHNLFGLDIDARAAQLAAFALMMKARATTRRVFAHPPKVRVYSVVSLDEVRAEHIIRAVGQDDDAMRQLLSTLFEHYSDVKNLGSLIAPSARDLTGLGKRIARLREEGQSDIVDGLRPDELVWLETFFTVNQILSEQYSVVITNPPYMGSKGMNDSLGSLLKKFFPNTKGDLFAAFMQRMEGLVSVGGYHVSVTMQSWMFLSSYEKYRLHLLNAFSIISLVHMANNVMGIAFQTAATIMQKGILGFRGTYQYVQQSDLVDDRPVQFPIRSERFARVSSEQFKDIPGSPIAYWASDRVREIFRENPKLGEIAQPRQGLATADNDRFLRLWHEVSVSRIGFDLASREEAMQSGCKWFPLNKGGEFRKWYGNQDYVVNWENDGEEIRNFTDGGSKVKSRPQNLDYYFREGITWTDISSSKFGVRYSPAGFISDHKGSCVFPPASYTWYLTGYLCSSVCEEFISYLNPTISLQVGNIASLPVVTVDMRRKMSIDQLVRTCVQISRDDWDSFETSWNFRVHPLLAPSGATGLSDAYRAWEALAEDRFHQLRDHETAINHAFAEIYGLEAKPVADEDITISRADRSRDAKSFLSYFVGCVMGRYSLDHPGLAYAGGQRDASRYQRFLPDADAIIPLTDDEYFEDDMVLRLQSFLRVLYGADTLQENLRWLADAIGGAKEGEQPGDRIRRYFCDEFYKDHLKTYRKRPIYWLFDSGKKKGFRALIYLHRYDTEMVARVRLQYVQVLQRQYAQEVALLNQRLQQGQLSGPERTVANRRLAELEDRQAELAGYDQRLAGLASDRMAIDLDDGVMVNYAKFADVLAPLK